MTYLCVKTKTYRFGVKAIMEWHFDPSSRKVKLTTGKYVCPSCNQTVPMKILSDTQIEFKAERIISMSANFDIEEAVEDNWRISLVECVSCHTKMIWQNYRVERTDEEKFYLECAGVNELAIHAPKSVINRFHVLMPKLDTQDDPLQKAILYLLQKYESNMMELVTRNVPVTNLKNNFQEVYNSLETGSYTKALDDLCKITESCLRYIMGETEGKKETLKGFIDKLFSFAKENNNNAKPLRRFDSLHSDLSNIHENFKSIKHQSLESLITIDSEYTNHALLTFNEMVKYLKGYVSNKANQSS